jgi:hypothetical protein
MGAHHIFLHWRHAGYAQHHYGCYIEKMQTSCSEICEAPFAWNNVSVVAFGEYCLFGVCCFLVYKTSHIVFLGWPRHFGHMFDDHCLASGSIT